MLWLSALVSPQLFRVTVSFHSQSHNPAHSKAAGLFGELFPQNPTNPLLQFFLQLEMFVAVAQIGCSVSLPRTDLRLGSHSFDPLEILSLC